MKLDYTLSELATIIAASNTIDKDAVVQSVHYDSRKIFNSKNILFFCLKGERRNGHEFIEDAYQKGGRWFVISDEVEEDRYKDALFLHVNDVLFALQELAKYHRKRFNYPVIAITGSTGKTTVKEWLYQLLQDDFNIVRSPKSFNSQLGVALSLLEMTASHTLAIIEAGISKTGEMNRLEEIIQPTLGVLTNIGTAHRENFETQQQLFEEKIQLFEKVQQTFIGESVQQFSIEKINNCVAPKQIIEKSSLLPWAASYNDNIQLTLTVANYLTGKNYTSEQINSLPQLAMRMEVFEGINNTTIINDAYNLDLEALKQSLEFLVTSNNKSKIIVVIIASEIHPLYQQAIQDLSNNYPINELIFAKNSEEVAFNKFSDATILIKGYRNSSGQKLAQRFKLQKHETVLEIDMDGLRNNYQFYRTKIHPDTKILVMVKAFAYGAGADKIAQFLERQNVDYLGVAYADEGVALRNSGIQTPILVLNAEPFSYETIIEHQLEPAIFSKKSLDEFIRTLINLGKEHYPIHLKIDSGMHRLGFEVAEIPSIINVLHAQPEVMVKGVYSHLADADNFSDESYTHLQVQRFQTAVDLLRNELSYPFIVHLSNSEGVVRFPAYQFDMIRMGIGLYGYITNPEIKKYLSPTIIWKTIISQIRTLPAGEKISYNGKYVTQKETRVATIPVGYADGLKRSYVENGGTVFINGKNCPIIGTICMDMCMVDVTEVSCKEGDEVELFGPSISIFTVAKKMNTIVYEVLTSISKRVHRVYLNE